MNFQVLFVSERMVVGVGFDCSPMVFAADERGIWYLRNFKNTTHLVFNNMAFSWVKEHVTIARSPGLLVIKKSLKICANQNCVL